MKFKFLILNIILFALLLFLVIKHVTHLPKKSSNLYKSHLIYQDFINLIKPHTNTLYYNDKKVDFAEFFKLHHLMSPDKNIINSYRQLKPVKFDYYLIKDFHKVKQKENLTGDTLLIKKFKDYNIYLLKTKT